MVGYTGSDSPRHAPLAAAFNSDSVLEWAHSINRTFGPNLIVSPDCAKGESCFFSQSLSEHQKHLIHGWFQRAAHPTEQHLGQPFSGTHTVLMQGRADSPNKHCKPIHKHILHRCAALENLHFWRILGMINCVDCIDRWATEKRFSGSGGPSSRFGRPPENGRWRPGWVTR
jgi:hypothetical protein